MNLARTSLAIAIAIILAVFIAYAVYVFYEPPKNEYTSSKCYEKHNCQKLINDCQDERYRDDLSNSQDCYSEIRQTEEYKKCTEEKEECEETFQKQTARYKHSRNSFIILVIIGAGAIIGGIFLSHLAGIGSGFVGGGILIILWSILYTWTYWYRQNKYLKLVSLAVVLGILIYLGYRKIEKKFHQ